MSTMLSFIKNLLKDHKTLTNSPIVDMADSPIIKMAINAHERIGMIEKSMPSDSFEKINKEIEILFKKYYAIDQNSDDENDEFIAKPEQLFQEHKNTRSPLLDIADKLGSLSDIAVKLGESNKIAQKAIEESGIASENTLTIAKKSLAASEESNRISNRANFLAVIAVLISIFSLLGYCFK